MNEVKEFFVNLDVIETQISETAFEPFPFPTTPYDFLDYAELDLKTDLPHALSNSLSNSKRALDCELDYFLKAYGLQALANTNKWQTGKKLRIVDDLGVMPNRILFKVNEARNDLEHRFQPPSHQTAINALDVVSIFVAAVDAYLYPVHTGAYFYIKDPDTRNKPLLERILTEHQNFLQLTKKEGDNIEALGRLRGVNYRFEVNAGNDTSHYLYLLTYLLHFHRFYMPNSSKFFSKLKYIKDDNIATNED